MGKLDNIQLGIYEIKNRIQNDSDVRKLLYHDQNNALDSSEVPFENVDENIVVSPIFDARKPPFDKSTMITIALDRGAKSEDEKILMGALKINVLTRSNLWPLVNNKIRPVQISNIIIDLLDDQKFSSSNKLFFDKIELAILDENINGYSLMFYITEGSGMVEDF